MNPIILDWLESWGLALHTREWIYWLVAAAAIALAVYIADVICRRGIIPVIKKLIATTKA